MNSPKVKVDAAGTTIVLTKDNFKVEKYGEVNYFDYYISSDYNIYNVSGVKIGRLMRDSDWNALSNWCERVFQKK